MGEWIPLDEWEDEVPQRCSVCGDVLSGRELGYLPIMCEEGREDCPGPTDRIRARVARVPSGEGGSA